MHKMVNVQGCLLKPAGYRKIKKHPKYFIQFGGVCESNYVIQQKTQQPLKRMKNSVYQNRTNPRVVQGREQRAQSAMIYTEEEENV